MEFEDKHKLFFNASIGAYSTVTDRENFDSQITVTKEEKSIILNYFGSENIWRGNKSSNPEKAAKQFHLYPDLEPVILNLVFPKSEKNELRLYLSSDQGFKPKGGDIWFIFINEENKIVIGSVEEEQWDTIGRTTKKHSFQPGAMSIIQMGEELIGHPNTAINELVKNGYDADAIECKVYFHVTQDKSNSFCIIYDNGSGMDENTLFGNWLKPSVSVKRKENARSEIFNRNLLGSKGIGRLASMALGENITVISRKDSNTLYNWLSIKKKDFKKDKLLSEINFPGDIIDDYKDLFCRQYFLSEREVEKNKILIDILKSNKLAEFCNGTLIIIENLDQTIIKILEEDFNQNELLKSANEPIKDTIFYKSLSTLITPLNINLDIQKELLSKQIIQHETKISNAFNNFKIDFGTNLLPNQSINKIDWQTIDSVPIQNIFDYRIYGKVEKNGNVIGLFDCNRIENYKFSEKFNIPFNEISDNSLRGKDKSLDLFNEEKDNLTGEYYFDIRVYDIGEKDNLEKLAELTNFSSPTRFKTAFKNIQGLRISKDGFGVKPYGEEVEDWIGLSKERVQNPGQNVNTNQILGYVFFFSPENDSLEEKTNREGFIENKAFIQVKNTLSIIFKTLGKKRYNFRLAHNIGRITRSKHTRPDTEEFLEKIKTVKHIDEKFIMLSEKFIDEVNTSMDNLEESLSFSERLASLGSGIELIYHEMAQPISGLRTVESLLETKKDKIYESDKQDFAEYIEELTYAIDGLVELKNSLQPAIGRTRKKKFSPYKTFIKVCNLYKSDLEEYEISIYADDILKDYHIEDLEYAFWIAFLNVINNAVYWIKRSEKPGIISYSMEDDKILISNNGPTIDNDIITDIFEYGVTTRVEKNATGLGLAFSRSILSRNNWNISAENREIGPTFIIKKLS